MSTDPAFRLRRAGSDDAARLARVGAELFAQAFGSQNRPDDMLHYLDAAFGEAKQREELAMPSSLVWLAEDREGRAIGYAHLKLQSSAPSLVLQAPAELVRIYSDQSWHGRGVGAALLDACVVAARRGGAATLWLGVWKNNPRGIAFYQKNGFRIAGEQVFQLGSDQQEDWIMVLDLT